MTRRPTVSVNQEKLIGLALMAIGSAALAATLSMNIRADGAGGARIFPLIASVAILCLGLLQRINSRPPPKNVPRAVTRDSGTGIRLAQLIAVAILYAVAPGYIGYLLSTGIATLLVLLLFGMRSPVKIVIVTVTLPFLYHLIFFVGFRIVPPRAEWFDLLNLLQGV